MTNDEALKQLQDLDCLIAEFRTVSSSSGPEFLGTRALLAVAVDYLEKAQRLISTAIECEAYTTAKYTTAKALQS